MNVLITSASRKVLLVEAFRQALSAEGGGRVLAGDASPLAAALYLADDCLLLPRSDQPQFIDTLLQLCQTHDIRLLVPTRDEELPLLAEHRQRFAEVNTTVMVSSPEAVRTCQDKAAFLRFCRENDFGVPRAVDPMALPADVAFPLFVKPRWSKGGQGAVRVDDREALDLAVRSTRDPIVQEFVGDPEYTIDLFADFQGRVLSAVPRQRLKIFGGEAFVSRTVRNELLIDESVRLAQRLGLVGHVTIQAFCDGMHVRLIEVNPRFGGAANLSFAAGAPSPRWLVKLLGGETLAPCLGEFRDRYVMLRYTQDYFIEEANLAGEEGA